MQKKQFPEVFIMWVQSTLIEVERMTNSGKVSDFWGNC